jgi:membrane-bound lytic murein transglycosylase B
MTLIRVPVAAIALAAALTAGATPQTPAPTVAAEASPHATKLPSTPEEHDAMAESYRKKAASYREEAAFHRKMFVDYKARVAVIPKSSTENPFIRNMREHCETFIKDAERLAVDADKFADYHHLRAEELRGK